MFNNLIINQLKFQHDTTRSVQKYKLLRKRPARGTEKL